MTEPWPKLDHPLIVQAGAEEELAEIEASPRDKQLGLLLEMQNAYHQRGLDGCHKSAAIVITISEKIARLEGFEAPQQIDVNHQGTLVGALIEIHNRREERDREERLVRLHDLAEDQRLSPNEATRAGFAVERQQVSHREQS